MTSIERLHRVQQIFPDAIGTGAAEGYRHTVRRELKIWERRGEVIPLWNMERWDRRTGIVRIPYVRVKTREQIRRARLRQRAILASAGLFVVGLTVWALWPVRYVALAIAGTIIGASWLAPHWRRGCTGLHCSGCRG